ncbi:hypothetical protein GLOTRDRAFT_92084 [Gloeophyllum trabeum ATCC 11539]|uniref:Uncharacterized protein n=1 Tax=Gloeophyllum trabeum (strain ATCC 11539 / FP-39264 / Madison 617) TaxID=670483 RepID=S7RUJ1_GLOTA|nr:uncharacterized protein GLOTRDRAFT_92084 [Gloeophyllum trabeum ATCC 11539]EPQ56869.1 hypothetical protein GLOTRDRAFT_92084 [Gloeophyllum trabeum ATCC 11539]
MELRAGSSGVQRSTRQGWTASSAPRFRLVNHIPVARRKRASWPGIKQCHDAPAGKSARGHEWDRKGRPHQPHRDRNTQHAMVLLERTNRRYSQRAYHVAQLYGKASIDVASFARPYREKLASPKLGCNNAPYTVRAENAHIYPVLSSVPARGLPEVPSIPGQVMVSGSEGGRKTNDDPEVDFGVPMQRDSCVAKNETSECNASLSRAGVRFSDRAVISFRLATAQDVRKGGVRRGTRHTPYSCIQRTVLLPNPWQKTSVTKMAGSAASGSEKERSAYIDSPGKERDRRYIQDRGPPGEEARLNSTGLDAFHVQQYLILFSSREKSANGRQTQRLPNASLHLITMNWHYAEARRSSRAAEIDGKRTSKPRSRLERSVKPDVTNIKDKSTTGRGSNPDASTSQAGGLAGALVARGRVYGKREREHERGHDDGITHRRFICDIPRPRLAHLKLGTVAALQCI